MRLGRIQNDYSDTGFDLVKKQGLSFLEICCNTDEETDNLIAAMGDVKKQIERTGLDVSCVGRWNHTIQSNGKLDEVEMKRYLSLLDTAVSLGAKTFVCGCNFDPSITLFRNYENAIRLFGTLCEHVKEKNIHVAVQNCDWNNFVCRDRDLDIVMGELPDLYLKYDASHAYNRGEDYLAILSKWGERVAHMHIKGITHAGTRPVDDPPAGMDDIAWPSLFAILYSRGYTGDLSIEPHSRAWMGERGEAGVLFTKKYISQFIVE